MSKQSRKVVNWLRQDLLSSESRLRKGIPAFKLITPPLLPCNLVLRPRVPWLACQGSLQESFYLLTQLPLHFSWRHVWGGLLMKSACLQGPAYSWEKGKAKTSKEKWIIHCNTDDQFWKSCVTWIQQQQQPHVPTLPLWLVREPGWLLPESASDQRAWTTVREGGGGPGAGNLIMLLLAALAASCRMSGLFKTAREALADLDTLAPVWMVPTTKGWHARGV